MEFRILVLEEFWERKKEKKVNNESMGHKSANAWLDVFPNYAPSCSPAMRDCVQYCAAHVMVVALTCLVTL